MAATEIDPRRVSSRAHLLGAATALLRSGGPDAVTVDAVTRAAGVARATLYRHFPSTSDLVAAAFDAALPAAPTVTARGSLRKRLSAVVSAQYDVLADPMVIAATAWVALAGELHRSPEVCALHEHLVARCVEPIRFILTGTDARAQLGAINPQRAAAELLGPITFHMLLGLDGFDSRAAVRTTVDAFLDTHAAAP